MGIDINTLAAAKNYVDETLVGAGGLKGEDGFSPVVSVKESSDTVYKLEITTAAAKFETPNLMASVTVEDTLSADSVNPVQNKAIVEALANKVNTNLLINPDFRVNQRGQAEYDAGIYTYTVDRWCTNNFPSKISFKNGEANIRCTEQYLSSTWGQIVEELDEGTYTFSVDIVDADLTLDQIFFRVYDYRTLTEYALSILATPKTTGFTSGRYTYTFNLPIRLERAVVYVYSYETEVNNSSFTIRKPKLELGSIATPFIPPDPATELVKCQRYYQIHSSGDINPVDLRPNMRITPTITQLSDGNYAYDAEIY